ncbi:MAG TPA: sigma-70 family RNA polymerase sigma factor [Pseudonocardia sp.]|jgi:RNA polymerase sigma-70 factor (ECF subfamily)|nr:sigma-70 family RNA polymerase sigma factor [Sporichthyaceae bacterium]HZZ48136.1 sigma-70 family RNA polymerase sigma factor [Pseudonocardia sp.]
MDDAALTALALAARAGDRQAATELAARTYQQVWRVLIMLTNRSVAEDLAQETYARAFRSLPGFRAESSVRAWLLSIARNTAADHLRANSVRRRLTSVDPIDVAEPAEPGDITQPVLLRLLIDGLDERQRVAFELTQVVGLSYAEAAQICDCPVGTIRSRVARARDELAAHLADIEGSGQRRARAARGGGA